MISNISMLVSRKRYAYPLDLGRPWPKPIWVEHSLRGSNLHSPNPDNGILAVIHFQRFVWILPNWVLLDESIVLIDHLSKKIDKDP